MDQETKGMITGSSKDLLESPPLNPHLHTYNNWNPTYDPIYGHNFPLFYRQIVPVMKRCPRIRLALHMLKGPITGQTFFLSSEEGNDGGLHETLREQEIKFAYKVEAENKEVEKFILRTLRRLWKTGIHHLLLAIDWGYVCCIPKYRVIDNKIHYHKMIHANPQDSYPLIRKDDYKLIGANIRGVYGAVGGRQYKLHQIVWNVHRPEEDPVFGQSRLQDAHVPWHEHWVQYGARDIVRTWYFRNSYDGGTMRYPVNKTKLPNGQIVENKQLALDIMSQIRTGGFRVLPSTTIDDTKMYAWDYEGPSGNSVPQGLLEYPDIQRAEILEAMGIPPEVVEGGSEGFGAATGRKVPLDVYHDTLFYIGDTTIETFEEFVLANLLKLNFKGENTDYEISRIVPLKKQQPAKPEAATNPITKTADK